MNPFLHEFQELFEPRLLKQGSSSGPAAEVASLQAADAALPPGTAERATVDLEAQPLAQALRIWDMPTRVFHWGLVAAVSVAIATGLVGGNWMELHGQAGLAIAGLLGFRLVWGFVGNRQARFRHFLPGPRRILAYLQGRWLGLGHNPLGALSVLALLGLLSLQVGTGLFGNDEIAFTGPLAARVDEALSLRLTGWHQSLSTVLFIFLGLHLAAILVHHLFKKDNLLMPMLHGRKQIKAPSLIAQAQAEESAAAARHPASHALYLGLALGAALVTVYMASGGWPQPTVPAQDAPSAGSTATTAHSESTASGETAVPATAASAAAPSW